MDIESKETIKAGVDELGAALDAVVDRIQGVIKSLDGWKLEIEIPAITIRLTRPPDKA